MFVLEKILVEVLLVVGVDEHSLVLDFIQVKGNCPQHHLGHEVHVEAEV